MQSTGRLLAAAVREALPRAGRPVPSAIFGSPICLRCGRTATAFPISSAPVRFFARKAKQATDSQPAPRRSKRPSSSSTASGNVKQQVDESSGEDSRAALMRLVAQLPAADVPVAIAALSERLHSPKAARQAEVIEAEVEEAQEEEEGDEWDENEAEYAQLRARLAKEGVITTEAGESIMSMEEVERQLREDGGEEDDDEEFVMAEEEEDEETDEQGEEDEQDWDEEDEVKTDSLQPSTTSSTAAPSSSTSTANTFWIQEHRDGTVTVTEWPFADDDTDDTDLADSYDLNMPHTASSEQSAIVGQAIGGEKLTRVDVLQMREKDIQEHFTKGSGKGGQKVNKSSNCVHLHHLPTGTIVKCHATRSLADNRRIAREIMRDRLEELVLGPASKNAKRAAKIRKQKAKGRRRAAVKYGDMDDGEEGSESVNGDVVKQHSSGGSSDSK